MFRPFTLFLIFISFCLKIGMISAQLHDNNIFQTVRDYSGRQFTARLHFDYDFDTLSYEEVPTDINMSDGNFTMSDSLGNLIFYSNGKDIYNKDHTRMENGDSMNKTGLDSDQFFYDFYAGQRGFYSEAIHSNPIPVPEQAHQYLVIHHPSFFINDFHYFKTFYSRIDMLLNEGSGAVIEKNVEFPINASCSDFCKHANGKDWWMIAADTKLDSFHLFLINDQGIIGPQSFRLGSIPDPVELNTIREFNFHNIRFSPQGNFFASVHKFSVDLFQFDRCTGEINFLRTYKIPYSQGTFINPLVAQLGDAEFSACENFLYVQNFSVLYQINLLSDQTIPHRLSMTYGKTSNLRKLPNDKVLIYSYNTLVSKPAFLGLISNPCAPGVSSLVNYTIFAEYTSYSPYLELGNLPYLPNYHLGALDPPPLEDCSNPVFNDALEEQEMIEFGDNSYYKLLRKYK